MSGGRRPQAEAHWQATLASRPLDARVRAQFHEPLVGVARAYALAEDLCETMNAELGDYLR